MMAAGCQVYLCRDVAGHDGGKRPSAGENLLEDLEYVVEMISIKSIMWVKDMRLRKLPWTAFLRHFSSISRHFLRVIILVYCKFAPYELNRQEFQVCERGARMNI